MKTNLAAGPYADTDDDAVTVCDPVPTSDAFGVIEIEFDQVLTHSGNPNGESELGRELAHALTSSAVGAMLAARGLSLIEPGTLRSAVDELLDQDSAGPAR